MALEVDTKRFQRVKEIFSAVCESPTENRLALLDSLCDESDDLRCEVESLLEHADSPALDIERAASQLGGLIASAARNGTQRIAPPVNIGPHRIVRLIGEGGMGVVYLAQQERPRRMVALKVIRPGFATPSLVRRFEHEAHVLGRLQHPGIAQIYDAGLAPTDGGVQPYLVMEYIEGLALLEYAKQREVSQSQRIQLMIDVCHAVQHAHLRGVIHRDLKPANILVNQSGQSKVLDFGVARVTDSNAQATIAPTAQGQLVGTLAYMSPEQLTGDHDAIDTRSDVYALGVICFELLTGSLPYEMKGRTLPELITAMQAGGIAPHSSSLRGDLQTVVLKAMNPDRERRYQSALALAEDLTRTRAGEPISARRDSVAYLVRKQLRRYRGVLLFVVLALCATTAFAVYSLNQAEEFARLAERERATREASEASEKKALASEQQASQRRDESQAVTGFLIAMLKMADPDITEDYDASVRTLLAEASRQVAGSFEQFPEAEAEIRGYLGRIYVTLGDLAEGESHLRRAIALYDLKSKVSPEVMYELLWSFLHVQLDVNDVLASIPRLRGERLGRSMIESIDAELAAMATELRQQPRRKISDVALQPFLEKYAAKLRSSYKPEHPVWLLAADQLHLLGLSHRLSAHPAHAAAYFGAALDLYRSALKETNPRVARSLGELTEALLESNRFDEAAVMAKGSLVLLQQKLPPDHWYIKVYEARVARAMLHSEHAPAAVPVLEACFESIAASQGDSSPLATVLLADLIHYYDTIGTPEKAREHRRRYAQGLAKAATQVSYQQTLLALAGDYPDVVESLVQWDKSFAARDPQKTDELRTRALQLSREQVDATSPFAGLLADAWTSWGGPYARRDLSPEAKLEMLEEARRITEVCTHRHGRKAAGTYWWLADYYALRRKGDAAVAMASKAVSIMQNTLPDHDTFIPVAQSLLAASLMSQGRLEESFPLALSSYLDGISGMGPADENTLIAMNRVLYVSRLLNRTGETTPIVLEHLQGLLQKPPKPGRCLTAAWHVLQHESMHPDLYRVALQLCQSAGDKQPLGTRGRTVMGAAMYRLGRLDEAVEWLQPLDVGEKTSVSVLTMLTMVHAAADRPAEAAAAFARLTSQRLLLGEQFPNTAEIMYAETARRLGR